MELKNNASFANASEESFWSVLFEKKYIIKIPRIQRDYAQGRRDKATKAIRDKFLEDIFSHLKAGKSLDINFIYGNLDNNNEFVPIDGQQRLTTLFLLYWYFASYSGQNSDDVKATLSRFKYETKFVAGAFCEKIVNNVEVDVKALIKVEREVRHGIEAGTVEKKALGSIKTISDAIKDYYWYFSDYENDSTIRAMLVMLDAIHNKVVLDEDTNYDDFFNLLIADNCPIKFLFLNLNDIGLTDSIYIKMNARGKPLTEFENFKARLSDYLKQYDADFAENFIKSINGKWAEFFWNKKYRPEADEQTMDDQMMRFFRFVLQNEILCNVDSSSINDGKHMIRRVLKTVFEENDAQFNEHIFKDNYQIMDGRDTGKPNLSFETYKKLSKLLYILSEHKKATGRLSFSNPDLYHKSYIDEEDAFIKIISTMDEKAFGMPKRLVIYSAYLFLIKNGKDATSGYAFNKSDELTQLMRVVFNMAENTEINGRDDYFRQLIRVNTISSLDNMSVLEYFARYLDNNLGFTTYQVEEERIKACLIIQSKKWAEIIARAENSFLGGQISSLLAFSGITDIFTKEVDDYKANNPTTSSLAQAGTNFLSKVVGDDSYYNKFETYLRKIEELFDPKTGLKEQYERNSIFRRALLCFGGNSSYLIEKSGVMAFLDNNDREYGLRRLLRDDNGGKRGYFKQFLDQLDLSKDFRLQMQSIIDSTIFTQDNLWKKFFVETDDLLESCAVAVDKKPDPDGNYAFKKGQRFISFKSKDEILLLEQASTRSINRELFTYVLYLEARKKNLPVKYYATFTESAFKYLYYTNNADERIEIYYQRDSAGDFSFIAKKADTQDAKNKKIDFMIDYIKGNIKMA